MEVTSWRQVADELAEALYRADPSHPALERYRARVSVPRAASVASGRPPFGSSSPAERELCARIVLMSDAGLTPGEVCRRLNAEHIPGPAGGVWHRGSVRAVVRRYGQVGST